MSDPPRAAIQWRVPFVRPDLPPFEAVEPAYRRIHASGLLTKGSELTAFEAEAARVLGSEHVVAVSSCSVGLALVMRALRAGRGSPDPAGRVEVILPSFIFLAAPAAVVWAGLEPVFVDVDPASWTIDPRAVAAALGPRTLAVLGCHTFGCPCDTDSLEAICDDAGVPLLVDAAHGLGSRRRGKQVGAEGFAQVFSLSPTKLVCAGEGGLVATSSPALAAALRDLREYGNDGTYDCHVPGLNGRMPEPAAALGRASLSRLPEVAARRAAIAAAYTRGLGGVPGLTLQDIDPCADSSWKDYSVLVDPDLFGTDRDGVRRALAGAGIDSRTYYDPPCHAMPAFRHHRVAGSMTVTGRLAAASLSLPMGGQMTEALAAEVAAVITRSAAGLVSGTGSGP
ncbi:MAG: DegT/DnrJ/EryC1/StrS family aminotransferase [Planctomycetes bacterium]|nr:DegT/DnrJ/EryC1/StrS family aminotransferase [Planctomycetota bacterium]